MSTLAFSYFSLSLWPFSELLAARNTYLNSFWFIGSFQKANHVTVLSCLTSFHLLKTQNLTKKWKWNSWEILKQFRYVSCGFLETQSHLFCNIFTLTYFWWCEEESNLSPGIGHSGIGAPFPILIVMSLGRMRLFNFPICKDNQALKTESSNKSPYKGKLWTSKYQNIYASKIVTFWIQILNMVPLDVLHGLETIQAAQL